MRNTWNSTEGCKDLRLTTNHWILFPATEFLLRCDRTLQYDPVARRLELEMHFSAHRSQPTKLTKARRRPTQLAATNTQAFATLPPESPTSSESELFRFGLVWLGCLSTTNLSPFFSLVFACRENREPRRLRVSNICQSDPICISTDDRQCRCHI